MTALFPRFELPTSNPVHGVVFHPKGHLVAAAVDDGSVQLWDCRRGGIIVRFQSDIGATRCIDIHPTLPLLVAGGDTDVKVYSIEHHNRRCLFTLDGHVAPIRSVQFHPRMPWILSGSDDGDVIIWNIETRRIIAELSEHVDYVLCARFHPSEDIVLSASMDGSVIIWDISKLRELAPKEDPTKQRTSDVERLSFEKPYSVMQRLTQHTLGARFAIFHPSLPLMISTTGNGTVRIWRKKKDEYKEIHHYREHYAAVTAALFHPKREAIVSCGEDNSILVYDFNQQIVVQALARGHGRFRTLAVHPGTNLFVAGRNTGMIVFKPIRERPAYALHEDIVYYVRNHCVHSYHLEEGPGLAVHHLHSMSSAVARPRTLDITSSRETMVLTFDSRHGRSYQLFKLPSPEEDCCRKHLEFLDNFQEGVGNDVVWMSPSRFAVFNKRFQTIEIRNLSNKVIKTIEPPLWVDVILYATRKSLILSSKSSVVLLDLYQEKVLAQIQHSSMDTLPFKYIIRKHDGKLYAFLNKQRVLLCDKHFSKYVAFREDVHIKSGVWDDEGVFVYSTLVQIKYCLPQGDRGVICTIDRPLYLIKLKGNTLYCLDQFSRLCILTINPTEYRSKLALLKNEPTQFTSFIQSLSLSPRSESVLAYLKQNDYPEIALRYGEKPMTRFDLAIESGELDAALRIAREVQLDGCWEALGHESLQQGNFQLAEGAYQRIRHLKKLASLYVMAGSKPKLARVQKIARRLNDHELLFFCSFHTRDVNAYLNTLRNHHHYQLLYSIARGNELDEYAASILGDFGVGENTVRWRASSATSFKSLVVVNPKGLLSWPKVAMPGLYKQASSILGQQNDTYAKVKEYGDVEKRIKSFGCIRLLGIMKGREDPKILRNPKNSQTHPSHVSNENILDSYTRIMTRLKMQFGICNFHKLKSLFLSLQPPTHHYMSFVGLLPPTKVILFYRKENSLLFGLILCPSLKSLQAKMEEGYIHFSSYRWHVARETFRVVLQQLVLVVVSSKTEAQQWRRTMAYAREYLLAVLMNIESDSIVNKPDCERRYLELLAYLTHCQLKPLDIKKVLMETGGIFFSRENSVHAIQFNKRCMLLFPNDYAEETKTFLTTPSPGSQNMIDISYNESTPFNICAATYTPIYQGSPLVRCPYTGASYLPQFRGHLDPLMELTEIGAPAVASPFMSSNEV